jgi:RPA family protein
MSDSGPGRREVAYRLFAAEFDDSELSYSESDEERAPNYVVTPTGARVNRLFAVGVLTEIEDVNPEMVRGRVVDPTGAFVTYAGQYQPDALAFLERADPPAFLALSGKARTYEPEDGDRIYTSVRPETVSEVDSETRDRWIVTAAERTIERIGIAASAIESGLSGDRLQAALSEAGVDDRLAEGVPLALEYYGTTPAYLEALRDLAVDAVRVVAGERDEVGQLGLAPGEGTGDASKLATLELARADDAPSTEGRAASADTGGERTETVSGEEGTGRKTTGAADPDGESGDGSTVDPTSGNGGTEAASDETEPNVEGSPETDASPASGVDEAPDRMSDAGSTATEMNDPATGSTAESDEETAAEGGTVEPEGELSTTDTASDGEGSDDFDPGEFELDEEERREVEEEFGTEFSTAGEVESPESDAEDGDGVDESESVEPNDTETEAEGTASGPEAESEPDTTASGPDTADSEPSAEPTGDGSVDLTDAVMDAMERLDEGEGADRDALVSTLADERGVAPEEVEDAIQDALMGGRCYEPADGTLKPI